MSQLQNLQRQRAFFKFILMGLNKRPMLSCMSAEEYNKWAAILTLRNELLEIHDDASKAKGLRIPEHRCWCGKEAKYEREFHGWVCKKHLTE